MESAEQLTLLSLQVFYEGQSVERKTVFCVYEYLEFVAFYTCDELRVIVINYENIQITGYVRNLSVSILIVNNF